MRCSPDDAYDDWRDQYPEEHDAMIARISRDVAGWRLKFDARWFLRQPGIDSARRLGRSIVEYVRFRAANREQEWAFAREDSVVGDAAVGIGCVIALIVLIFAT